MRLRLSVAGLIAGAALVIPAVSAGASTTTVAASAATIQSGTSEYVIAYQAGARAQAEAAVGAAGGTVVDTNDDVGLLLVETTAPTFPTSVGTSAAVTGVAHNHSVGTTRPGMPHRYVEDRPAGAAERAAAGARGDDGKRPKEQGADPLAPLQWDMAAIGATPGGAWRKATGRDVQVGIIDTGIDATNPDIAPNFNRRLSVNFTTDVPDLDGPCEVASCVDPADTDDGGHGTHVAGIVAGARNGIGITGVAPDAELVNVRAGQDSGFFFLWETVKALTYAGKVQLDVVNMSFYTDPWLFNCASADQYVQGTPTADEIKEQALTRTAITAALNYAHRRGVTLVAAAGNGHQDYSAPTRFDDSSPDFPVDTNVDRVVTKDCLDLPSEGPNVIAVGSLGPSLTKADYSNYGLGSIDVAAPGGFFRDGFGTPTYRTAENEILSSYPLHVAIAEGLADANGNPVDDFSRRSCDAQGNNCGFYTFLQGTSMASPHAAGVAALIIDAQGRHRGHSVSLEPDKVRSILLRTATDHACPPGGVRDYTQEGRDPSFTATCTGTTANNGFYGEGIINATAAVKGGKD